MAEERTFTIAKKYVIDEGLPSEHFYDEVMEYKIKQNEICYYVCIVREGKKYGILDHTGKLVVPLIYDHLAFKFQGGNEHEPLYEYFLAHKNGKQGIIARDGSIIFPFIYEHLCTELIENISSSQKLSYIFYLNQIDDKFKYGLAKWPSGEIIYPPLWDIVRQQHSPLSTYYLCGILSENVIWNLHYRWNIMKIDTKLLFDKCKYVHFINYSPNNEYNIAANKVHNYHKAFGYSNYDFEIFHRDGTISYHGKCYTIEHLDGYHNVFLIKDPDEHDDNRKYLLCICYQDENHKQQAYTEEYSMADCQDSCYAYAKNIIKNNKDLQKIAH